MPHTISEYDKPETDIPDTIGLIGILSVFLSTQIGHTPHIGLSEMSVLLAFNLFCLICTLYRSMSGLSYWIVQCLVRYVRFVPIFLERANGHNGLTSLWYPYKTDMSDMPHFDPFQNVRFVTIQPDFFVLVCPTLSAH